MVFAALDTQLPLQEAALSHAGLPGGAAAPRSSPLGCPPPALSAPGAPRRPCRGISEKATIGAR
eukprot:751267-Lingulodinium_polyedra.AAC.1